MYKIVSKRRLNETMTWLVIEAPLVARKAKPGQFIILRTDEHGERIPLTMAGHDSEKGTIDLIYAAVGRTTMLMDQLEEGDYLMDVVGPLGKPTEMEGLKKVCVVGGGTGNALAYPLACGMHDHGIHVDMIAGFKSKAQVILEDEFKAGVDRVFITTGRTADDDEVHLQDRAGLRHPFHRVPDGVYDRRYRHVRRLPLHRRRREQVRLRGWSGI